MWGSCNGLLCLSFDNLILIWNPAIRKHVKLPTTSFTLVPRTKYDNSFAKGFGYDSVSDDYKLVMLFQVRVPSHNPSFLTETKVYSMRLSSWRVIECFGDYLVRDNSDNQGPGVFVCGALHWVGAKRRRVIEDLPNCVVVVAFDLAKEMYDVVALPDFSTDHHSSVVVSELDGCLSVVCTYFEAGVVDVWVMNEYGVRESWTKLFTFSGPEMMKIIYCATSLAYSGSGDEVVLVLNSEKFVSFNLEKRILNFVHVCGLPKQFYATICLDSLVFLGDKGENDEKQGGVNVRAKEDPV